MPEPSEYSESGAPIYRHKEPEREFEMAIGDSKNIELLEKHIAEHLGEPDTVFHELISDLVHIDVHILNPTPERRYYMLITTGMSDRPMTVEPGAEELAYAELMLCLPADWPMSQESWKDGNNYWPVQALKFLARMPHEYKTRLGDGHTIPNGDPAENFAPNTKFCCMMLAPPRLTPVNFWQYRMTPQKLVHFYAILPLYREEMDLKLRMGADELFDRFDRLRVTELIDLWRPNAALLR